MQDVEMLALAVDQRRKDKKFKPYVKAVVSGDVIEIYTYDIPPYAPDDKSRESQKKGHTGDFENDDGIPDKTDRSDEIRKKTAYRRRNTFRRRVLANFTGKKSKFYTFTFEDDIRDIHVANKYWSEFVRRMRDEFGKFQYATVIEFQDKNRNGVVHYHMIANLPYIDFNELTKLWGNGHVYVKSIKHVDNVGAYMIKYMCKDLDDKRLDGKKAYMCSQGLEKEKVYRGHNAELLLQAMELDQKKAVFTNSYESEYNGMVNYREYNLKRS